MTTLVFLPATAPDDRTFGSIPERIEGYANLVIHPIRFPVLVWYNQAVRDQVLRQVDAWQGSSIVWVGFSKSGLGAWNLACAVPRRTLATIIFDAPVAREEVPPWDAAAYYPDRDTWLADLPIRHIAAFKAALPAEHRLVLISGASFHGEMAALSSALTAAGVGHHFLSRPRRKHHWNSGWIEEALPLLAPPDRTRLGNV